MTFRRPGPGCPALAAGLAATWLSALPLAAQEVRPPGPALSFSGGLTAEASGPLGSDLPGDPDYAHELRFDVEVDLERAVGWRGAALNVRLINRAGEDYGLTEAGTTVQTQEIAGAADPDVRLLFLTLSQDLAGGRVNLLGGRTVMSGEFAASPVYCDFQTLALCGQPVGLILGGAWQSYPGAVWGGRVRWTPTPWLDLRLGAYQRDPGAFGADGFDLSAADQTGVAYPLEVAYLPQGDLPGRYAVGAIYDTSDREDLAFDDEGRLARLTGQPLRLRDDRQQLYATFDQMVWRAGEGRTNGAIVFGGVTVEPDEAALVDRTWFLGTSIRGIVPGRPDDNIGLQVTQLRYSDAARAADRAASLADGLVPRDRDTETVLEAHYGVQFTDRIRLAPNVQYLWNAGGDGEDGAVWGLRLDVSF